MLANISYKWGDMKLWSKVYQNRKTDWVFGVGGGTWVYVPTNVKSKPTPLHYSLSKQPVEKLLVTCSIHVQTCTTFVAS